MLWNGGAGLDFAEEMPERRRAQTVKMLDEALAAELAPRTQIAQNLRCPGSERYETGS
jgi:hypothetical protein